MKNKCIFVLVILMVMSFSGCGKKENNSASGQTASKDHVYKMEDISFGTENQGINQILRSEAGFYAYGYSWSEEGDSSLDLYKLNEDGTAGEAHSIPIGENVSIRAIQLDDEGNIYCIKNDFRYADETAEVEESGGFQGENTDDYYLTKMSLSGEEFYSVKLNDIPELKEPWEENGYFYVGDMILDRGKGLYINFSGSFACFDLECNFEGMVSVNGGENPLDGAGFITLDDGRIVAVVYEGDVPVIAAADLEQGTIGEKYEIPGVSYEYTFYAGAGYDLYMTNTYGLYGYNLGDADKTMLMSYIDSDFGFYNIYQVTAINENEFFAVYDNMETGEAFVAKFTRVPPEQVKEKQEITLAMAYTDWNIRRAVISFNKANENFRISILDYGSMYSDEDDYMAAINRLNTDIVSGKTPDILLIGNEMPVDSYIGKGLFEDLKPYIEKDGELDINNFMPNILEAFSTNGKMYRLVPSYSIETMVAKASDVGNERGWTVREAAELLSGKPEGTQLLENTTRENMLDYCMSMSGDQFIDWESGACSFNSDSFIQMLEFIGTFPEKIDSTAFEDDYWENRPSMWREGKVLALINTFGDFRSFNRIEKGTFGEDITMIGFPSANGDGTVICPDLQLAMSAKSKVKDGAWEFLRTFITDEYQKDMVNYSFPLSIKRLDELTREATEKPYFIDEDNNKVEYDDSYYVGGEEILIPPMTKQEAEEFREQLYSFTHIYKSDDDLIKIIEEEAAPFFAGQKSVKEAAGIIQSRVQLYVNENL